MKVKVGSSFVDVSENFRAGGIFNAREVRVIENSISSQIDSGPTGSITDQTPTFTFHTIGGLPLIFQLVSIDQGTPGYSILAADTNTYTPSTPLPNGDYTFRVLSVDNQGHVEAAPQTQDFTVAVAIPPLNSVIDTGPTGTSADDTPTFTYHSDNEDQTPTYERSVDQGTAAYSVPSAAETFTAPTLADGAWTFRVRASDSRGAEASPATRSFIVDAVAPPPPAGQPPFPPVSAITAGTATITSSAAWVAAAKLSTNAGKTLGVASGTYNLVITGDPGAPAGPASLVTFVPTSGATVQINGMDLQMARNIRFEGIQFKGGVDLVASPTSTPNTNIQFYGCEWAPFGTNGQFNGINAQDQTKNILIQGCYFHDLTQDINARWPNGNYDTGYALHLSGGAGAITNFQIKSCKFDNMHNDAIQLSSFNTVLVDRCEFSNATYYNPGAHIDGIQHFGGSNLTVSNCFLHNWNEHQQFFGENGLNGTNLFFNNLLLGGTFVNNFGFENPSYTSTNITLDHNTQTAGTMHLNWRGTGVFTVTDNIAPNFSTALGSIPGSGPSQVAVNSGNHFGSIGSFDADHESTTYPGDGYTKPTGVWW